MILKRKDKPKANYTVVSNSFLRDPSLSLKAKGMLTLLMSLPDDWCVSIRGLQTMCADKKGALSGALAELRCAEFISSARTREDDGLYRGIVYKITDKAYGIHPQPENRDADNRDADNRDADNQPLLNKEIQNKERKNTYLQKSKRGPEMSVYAAVNADDGLELD